MACVESTLSSTPCACSAQGSMRTRVSERSLPSYKARTRQAASPLAVIADGLSRRELLQLIGPWRRFAARELGVRLTVAQLKVTEPSLRGIWRSLCQALDGTSVVILGLDGAERHWTVAYVATE